MTETNSKRAGWPVWRLILIILSVIAFCMTAIYSWHFITGADIIGCGEGKACDTVMNSRWSAIAGVIPVSALAMGVYLALIVSVLFSGPNIEPQTRNLSRKVMLILAGAITGSAVWFTMVQKFLIGEFCMFCLSTHFTGLIISIIIIVKAEKSFSELKYLFFGLVLAGFVVVSQISISPAKEVREGESFEGKITLDYSIAPLIGPSEAKYKVIVLYDYQCQHCLKLHNLFDETVSRYNGKLAFVLCPAPLSPECNPFITREIAAFRNSCELAKTGLAVWYANKEAFTSFENYMFSNESIGKWRPRTPEQAREKAIELIGEEVFSSSISDPKVEQYLKESVQIFGQTSLPGKNGVPKLVYGSRWLLKEIYSVDELIASLHNAFDIPKP